jgi:hypothetical protein
MLDFWYKKLFWTSQSDAQPTKPQQVWIYCCLNISFFLFPPFVAAFLDSQKTWLVFLAESKMFDWTRDTIVDDLEAVGYSLLPTGLHNFRKWRGEPRHTRPMKQMEQRS